MTTETRNTNPGMQLDLLAPAPSVDARNGIANENVSRQRLGIGGNENHYQVGARQPMGAPPPGGGGYLSSCSALDVALGDAPPRSAGAERDPRIDELRQLGLGPVWVLVAESIGYETFLAAWAVMSANPDFMDSRNRITIPNIARLHTYQRNLAVRSLARRGFLPRQIRDEMIRTAGLLLSLYQIQHIIREATP